MIKEKSTIENRLMASDKMIKANPNSFYTWNFFEDNRIKKAVIEIGSTKQSCQAPGK